MSTVYGVDPDVSGRISALRARKMLLETKIKEELNRPQPSNDILNPLKLSKLQIKRELEQIKDTA